MIYPFLYVALSNRTSTRKELETILMDNLILFRGRWRSQPDFVDAPMGLYRGKAATLTCDLASKKGLLIPYHQFFGFIYPVGQFPGICQGFFSLSNPLRLAKGFWVKPDPCSSPTWIPFPSK